MMHDALLDRRRVGVDVRLIGKVFGVRSDLPVHVYPGRLHVRVIIRDGTMAFIGSQSLNRSALDDRREIRVIVREPAIVRQMRRVFEQDWQVSEQPTPVRLGESLNSLDLLKGFHDGR